MTDLANSVWMHYFRSHNAECSKLYCYRGSSIDLFHITAFGIANGCN
jgi:hypothetical protein